VLLAEAHQQPSLERRLSVPPLALEAVLAIRAAEGVARAAERRRVAERHERQLPRSEALAAAAERLVKITLVRAMWLLPAQEAVRLLVQALAAAAVVG
jgi:hypothetical protein